MLLCDYLQGVFQTWDVLQSDQQAVSRATIIDGAASPSGALCVCVCVSLLCVLCVYVRVYVCAVFVFSVFASLRAKAE